MILKLVPLAYIGQMSPKSFNKLHHSMQKQENGLLPTLLPKAGVFAIKNRLFILLGFGGLFVVSLIGVYKIQVNDNPINWFKSSHEIRIADKTLNQHFGGTYDAWFVLKNTNDTAKFKQAIMYDLVSNKILAQQQLSQVRNSTHWQQELISLLDDQLFEADENQADKIQVYIDQLEQSQTDSKVFLKPENLKWMQGLQASLIQSGLVGKINGLPDIVKTVNRELNGGFQSEFTLPASQEAVAQTLLQYQSSHRPQDLWHFVTPDYSSSLMWLQLTSGDNQHMSKVITYVENYITKNPLPIGIEYGWAGKTYLNVIWQKAMVNGMLESLLSAFVIVFLMMVILFRSIKYGILAMLPLTLTITLIYGLIGWVGKDYDMPIAVLSELTLGLSVDFAIHFLQRFRTAANETDSTTQALQIMFQEPARAISRNAIVIAVGFLPLLAAPLVPYITVGVFLASIMALSGIVTLILLPSILSLKGVKHG